MELRLETSDGSDLPKGYFVSVRVGDVQKQRRYENKGAFQFPAPAHSRKAKIDLYMHVGTCTTSVGPDNRVNEVKVQPLDGALPFTSLQIETTLKAEALVDRETKMSNVKREAVEYLSKWLIQERLGEAVKALLQKRPDDPIEFICGYLRAHSSGPPPEPVKPAPAGPVKPAPAEPVKKPAPAVPAKPQAAPLLPFDSYYRSSVAPEATSFFPRMYAKFPKKESKPVPAAVDGLDPEVVKSRAREALEKVFLDPEEEDESPAKEPAEVLAKEVPPVASPVARKPISRPEWLKANAPPLGEFGVYYKNHLEAAMPTSPWGVLYSKFGDRAEAAAPIPRPPEDGPEEAVQGTAALPELVKGSLAPREQEAVVAQVMFQASPSVGTWLQPRPRKSLPQGTLPAHVKAAWDLRGLRPAKAMSTDERCEAERVISSALLDLTGNLEGEYLPLPTSTSYPGRPGGMSLPERDQLESEGLLLQADDAPGRGVFVNAARDVAVWVNGSHHLGLMVKQDRISAEEAMLKLRAVKSILRQAVQQQGYDLAGPVAMSSKRLSGLSPPQLNSTDELCEVERVCTRAFFSLTNDLQGEYFPMSSSMSYPPRLGGMSESEEHELMGAGLVLGSSNATGRGVFMTNARDLAIIVNGTGHMDFVVRQQDMPIHQAQARIQNAEDCLHDAIRQSGYAYV